VTRLRRLLRASLVLGAIALSQPALAGQSEEATAAPPVRRPLALGMSLLSSLESEPTHLSSVPPETGRMTLTFGYNRPRRRSTFEIAGSSVVPYSSGVRRELLSFGGGVQVSRIFGRRTQFTASQSVSEAPFDLSGFAGRTPSYAASDTMAVPLTTNGSLTVERELRYDGAMTLTRTLSRRSSAALSFVHTGSMRPGVPAATSQLGAARFSRRVSPSVIFLAGYGFGVASFASGDREAGRRHDIDLGFSFERPLPFSGRTLFSAGTGSTVLTDGRTHRLRLVASGTLSRDLGRAWSSRIAYSRPMHYIAGFRQPFLSDALSVSLDGRVRRTWFLSGASGFARGAVGFATGGPAYDSYSASVRLQRQIARAWRVEAEGFLMHFAFAGADLDGAALPPLLRRRGVRFGISWATADYR